MSSAGAFNPRQGNANSAPSISQSEFRFFSQLIKTRAGIDMGSEKVLMLKGRLNKRIRALGLSCYSQYIDYLKNDITSQEIEKFVNSLTTNKTEFFREKFHFGYLRDRIKDQVDYNTFYFWAAACSTGENTVKRYGNAITPYNETKHYVKKVIRLYSLYQQKKL